MPAIARGSSARSRRRQPSEDNIEDGDPSQRSRSEDVEDAEEAQPARASSRKKSGLSKSEKVKKEKLASSSRRDEDDQESEEDENPGIDIENFRDQKLSRQDATKIVAMSDDWKAMIRTMRRSTFPLIEDIALAMAEAGENRDGEEALKDLEQTDLLMRELLDLQAEYEAHQNSLLTLANDIQLEEEIENVIDRYNFNAEDRKEKWQIKTSRQKYAKDEDYVKFKSSIYEVQHPDEGMPPLTDLMPKEDGDDSDDEEIAVGGVSQKYTCPITLTILVKPVTSQVCHHSFSKAAIEEYLRGNRSIQKKCPASGCSKHVALSDFKPNFELEQKVKVHVRREQRRQAEADSGDDNVEEIID